MNSNALASALNTLRIAPAGPAPTPTERRRAAIDAASAQFRAEEEANDLWGEFETCDAVASRRKCLTKLAVVAERARFEDLVSIVGSRTVAAAITAEMRWTRVVEGSHGVRPAVAVDRHFRA